MTDTNTPTLKLSQGSINILVANYGEVDGRIGVWGQCVKARLCFVMQTEVSFSCRFHLSNVLMHWMQVIKFFLRVYLQMRLTTHTQMPLW